MNTLQEHIYIEPCCYDKQLTSLIEELEGGGTGRTTATFFSNSDWDLSMLLPYLARRVPACEVMLFLVQIEQKTLYAIERLMDERMADGRYAVSHFTLLTNGLNRKEIRSYLSRFPSTRLTVCEDVIGYRCLALHNDRRRFLVHGSLNQHIYNATQLYSLTTDLLTYLATMQVLDSKRRVKKLPEAWRNEIK